MIIILVGSPYTKREHDILGDLVYFKYPDLKNDRKIIIRNFVNIVPGEQFNQ